MNEVMHRLAVGGAFAAFGALLMTWGLSERPVRRARGIGSKLKILASNGFQGPNSAGRPFFAGVGFVLFGFLRLLLGV